MVMSVHELTDPRIVQQGYGQAQIRGVYMVAGEGVGIDEQRFNVIQWQRGQNLCNVLFFDAGTVLRG